MRFNRSTSRCHHQLAQNLGADFNLMALCQIRACQRRAEVRIMLAHKRHYALAGGIDRLAVARPTAFTRDQTFGAVGAHPAKRPKTRRRCKPRKLATAHRQHRHNLALPWEDHEHRVRRQGPRVSSLSSGGVSFLNGTAVSI